MTTALRYQLVQNTSNPAAVMTAETAPPGDGSDRSYRVIERILAAIDVGAEAGKTQNASGCIVAVLPAGTNILVLEGRSYKQTVNGPPPQFRLADNMSDAAIDHIANITYWFNTADNTIRVRDYAADAAVQLAANDIIVINLTFGPNP